MSEEGKSPEDLDLVLKRANELKNDGFDWSHAWSIAWLEHKIKEWPAGWGNDLVVLLYGDFEVPKTILEFPSLGITIFNEKLENTVIRNATCVLKAHVNISGKSIPALIDASQRINLLLGSYSLVGWGNSGCGWWSWVTHEDGGGVLTTLDHTEIPNTINGILKLPVEVRKKVDAALYWIREPRNLMMDFYKRDILRIFSAYWNAFECLVDAVNIIRPQTKLPKAEKQKRINEILKSQNTLTIEDIQKCYTEIVNPGLFGKASHALEICFQNGAQKYINECFRLKDKKNRLYDIRNAINHGDIDAENLDELMRISSRLHKLWIIVWGLFGRLIPFSAPLDKDLDIVEKDK